MTGRYIYLEHDSIDGRCVTAGVAQHNTMFNWDFSSFLSRLSGRFGVVFSMNGPKMLLHVSFFGVVMADWQRSRVTVKNSSRSLGTC